MVLVVAMGAFPLVVLLFFLLPCSEVNCDDGTARNMPNGKENGTLQVETQNGMVQGIEMKTDAGMPFFAYRGIPYAAPPIGDLRFRSPRPASNWDGILDATHDRAACMQIGEKNCSEDCLFINVYTPKLPKSISTPLPVMVWIYGGAFLMGYSRYEHYGPDFLLEKDVVFVSFNYRVGVFGFLSTEDEHSPGNYGIKDQIAALRWVKANIKNFGGNPDNVTIFGQSAGAASVGYLLLAPKAKNLFHRAIAQSGSTLCPWAQQDKPKSTVSIIGNAIGNALGIVTSTNQFLVQALRNQEATSLLAVSNGEMIMNLFSPLNGLAFSPSKEPEHEDAIFTENVHELLKRGEFNRVPLITGFTTEEFSLLQEYTHNDFTKVVAAEILLRDVVPKDMNTKGFDYIQSAFKIKMHYFGFILNSIGDKKEILKFLSEAQFIKPIMETIRQVSKYTEVYFYQFSYEGDAAMKGLASYSVRSNDKRYVDGVSHCEELFYLFKKSNVALAAESDIAQKERLTTLWTNFAKYGTPTAKDITWAPVENENLTCLNIGEELEMIGNPKKDVMEFWYQLYKEHGTSPYNTY